MANTPFSDDIGSRIILQGIHIDLTPALQNIMREKFSVLFRHHERILRVNINLHKDQTRGKNHHFSATGQVEIAGPDLVATVRGDDAYEVIDGLVEKLDEQLRERHERRKDKRNHPRAIELEAELPKMETRTP
jgi:putative sigma-54 modulation protein